MIVTSVTDSNGDPVTGVDLTIEADNNTTQFKSGESSYQNPLQVTTTEDGTASFEVNP